MPRSPKRVLFSLDNEVVSPSTSPIVQRAKLEQGAIKASQPRSLADRRSVSNEFEWTKALPNGTSLHGSANGNIHDERDSTPLPGFINPSPAIGGDDFESIDADDELFTFDEEIGNGEAEVDSDPEIEDDLGSDNDEQNGESLTASSPHAGSLPIEIKWPSRLGPRK